uniref:Uncharacterized protein n=1 Tax=Odontella aurita TaxID=265563 RepID=A0A7S4JIA5_9STRA|mmetsp:Transcript_46855/g.141940  ORF Transcript_46855/g.141940 Transcript_46855/m.141940 type:complete len:286 (+) Transcript_46855:201-1058(+)
MFDLSLSVVAWLAVVIFQAIIHFGVIGPRSRRQRERLEKEQMEIQNQLEESDSRVRTHSTGDEYEEYAASLASAAVEAEEEAEEAETDSREDVRISSLHESRRGSLTQRNKQPHLAKKYGSSSIGSSRDLDPAHVDDSHPEGDDDNNSCVDEDEPWRYELVRYYYSPRSPHVIQLDQYRQHEDYDSDEGDKDSNDLRSRMRLRRSWKNSRRNLSQDPNVGSVIGRKQAKVTQKSALNKTAHEDSSESVLYLRNSEKNKDRHVAFVDNNRHSPVLTGLASQAISCA